MTALDDVIGICAVDGIQFKVDSDRRRKIVEDARQELSDFRDGVENGWKPLMREIAKLSDAMDFGDWSEADDDTLLEQFDPWSVIRKAIDRLEVQNQTGSLHNDDKIPREELEQVIDRLEKDIEAGISSRNWLPYLAKIRTWMSSVGEKHG